MTDPQTDKPHHIRSLLRVSKNDRLLLLALTSLPWQYYLRFQSTLSKFEVCVFVYEIVLVNVDFE